MKRIDMGGQRYGKLLVVRLVGKNKFGARLWECLCDCGATRIAPGNSIRYGKTLSCGCGQRAVLGDATRTHGKSKSRVYGVFHAMHKRCGDSNDEAYGGRGITVCERWSGFQGFENFLADMGEPPIGLTLERKNVNGNYEFDNCCWATRAIQANNRRTTRLITWKGETHTLTQWAGMVGHSAGWLAKRLARYSLDEAMEPLSITQTLLETITKLRLELESLRKLS